MTFQIAPVWTVTQTHVPTHTFGFNISFSMINAWRHTSQFDSNSQLISNQQLSFPFGQFNVFFVPNVCLFVFFVPIVVSHSLFPFVSSIHSHHQPSTILLIHQGLIQLLIHFFVWFDTKSHHPFPSTFDFLHLNLIWFLHLHLISIGNSSQC